MKKYLKLPRLRRHEHALQYVPDQGPRERALAVERSVPHPAHLSIR